MRKLMIFLIQDGATNQNGDWECLNARNLGNFQPIQGQLLFKNKT